MDKLPQIRSVQVRMLVVLLPPVAVAIGALTLMAINRATAAETESRFSEMRQIAAAGANEFDADAHANQALGRSLAAMIQVLGDGVTRTQVNAAVEQFQDRNPDLAGTYVGFERNAFDGADAAHRGAPGSDEPTTRATRSFAPPPRRSPPARGARSRRPTRSPASQSSRRGAGRHGRLGLRDRRPRGEVLAPIEVMRNGLILIGLVLLLLAGAAIALFATRLTRPIAAVTAAAEKVSEGASRRPSTSRPRTRSAAWRPRSPGPSPACARRPRPPSGSPRAISPSRSSRAPSANLLGQAFVKLTGDLRDIVGRVSGTAESVSAASQQMASTSEEAGRAVGEIASAVGEVGEPSARSGWSRRAATPSATPLRPRPAAPSPPRRPPAPPGRPLRSPAPASRSRATRRTPCTGSPTRPARSARR